MKKWLIRFMKGVYVVYEAPSREHAERKARELARTWNYPTYEVLEYEG